MSDTQRSEGAGPSAFRPPPKDARAWRRRPIGRALVVGAVVLVAAAGGSLFALTRGPAQVLPNGLDVVEQAAAAVRPTGDIEHVRSVVDGNQYEYWSLAGRSSRTVVTDKVGRATEYTATPVCSILAKPPTTPDGCLSTGEALEAALASREARVAGDGEVRGRPVKRIAFDVRDSGASGTYEVDATSMAPVRLTVTTSDGAVVVEQYEVFEYLADTPENRALAGSPG
ncbi:MAG: hypothetical protein ABL982_20865 [Vicinamibacterales bacterium]